MSQSCRSCGAPVVWGVTEKGRRMPLDAEPVAWGNIELDEESGRLRVLAGDEPRLSGKRYISHFATCPEAKAHRRRT